METVSITDDNRNARQTHRLLSSQTRLPSEMSTLEIRPQSPRGLSFLHIRKTTPVHIEPEKKSLSLATHLSSDLSPGITTERLGASFSTPPQSWAHEKNKCKPGVSDHLGLTDARDMGNLSSNNVRSVNKPEIETLVQNNEAGSGPTYSPGRVSSGNYQSTQQVNADPTPAVISNFVSNETLQGTDAVDSLATEKEETLLSLCNATKDVRNATYTSISGFFHTQPDATPPLVLARSTGSAHSIRQEDLSLTPSTASKPIRREHDRDPARKILCGGHFRYTRGESLGYYPVSENYSVSSTEIRQMLINAEKELAEVRQESAKRGMILESLRVALDRERANTQAIRAHYAEQIQQTQSEHTVRVSQLCEQIHVLRTVSDRAMLEKAKSDEEAVQKRREMLSFLEKERAEKSSIMADYREQTEALIEEQGKEITALRAALDQIKGQYGKLETEHVTILNARDLLECQLEEHRHQLDSERVDGARRLRELQNRLMGEKEALLEELHSMREAQLREGAKWQSKHQELLDQLEHTQEKVAAEQEGKNCTLENFRRAHRKELEALRKELEYTKEAYAKQMVEHRSELERAVQNEQRTLESLRQSVKQLSDEKDEAIKEIGRQRAQLHSQHRNSLSKLQAVVDALTKEVAQERKARKEADSNAEVLLLRTESLQKTLHETSCKLEALEMERNTKYHIIQESHRQELESLGEKLCQTGEDLASAQKQIEQEGLTQRHLREELAAKSATLECLKAEQKDAMERAQAERARMGQDYAFREEQWVRTRDELEARVKTLEEQRLRLERALNEDKAKLDAMTKKVESDREGLESAHRELHEALRLTDDLSQKYDKKKKICIELLATNERLTAELEKSQAHGRELEEAVEVGLRRLEQSEHELEHQRSTHKADLNELVEQHKGELVGLHLVVEQVRMEFNQAQDLIRTKDVSLAQLRQELVKLRRDAEHREDAFQESLANFKIEHEKAMRYMDELLHSLRADLSKSQFICAEYQRELENIRSTREARYSDLEAALEQSEAARARHQNDSRYRDQLNQELQSTIRLLTNRLCAHEEEIKRLQEELADTTRRAEEVHSIIGRKDSMIAQLSAKLRAYESRGFLL